MPAPADETLPADVAADVIPADAPALVRFAAPFEAPAEALPFLSVVLVDDGSLAGADAAVASLPFPVSVALDPLAPGASALMAAYRARGIEVLALVELPVGAQPVDAAVNYEAILAILPEAVAVLDLGLAGLETQGAVADQALARLARDGRGAVLLTEGLGGAFRQAEAAGVPALPLLRDLDAEGQDSRVIRRFLDDAARRAGQEGQAVLLGRVRPETLSALALWGSARRAQEVTVAPVSAVLGAPAGE